MLHLIALGAEGEPYFPMDYSGKNGDSVKDEMVMGQKRSIVGNMLLITRTYPRICTLASERHSVP